MPPVVPAKSVLPWQEPNPDHQLLHTNTAHLQTALDNPQLFELRQRMKPFDFPDGLPNNAENLKIRKAVETDHPRITAEEHLQRNARQAFLAKTTVCEAIASTLVIHIHNNE